MTLALDLVAHGARRFQIGHATLAPGSKPGILFSVERNYCSIRYHHKIDSMEVGIPTEDVEGMNSK